VCGVAGEQYPPGPVPVRHSLVDPKPGSPDHFSHPHRGTAGPAGVQQSLRKDDVRLLRRIVDFGNEPERPVRKRRHDQHARFGEEQQNLVPRQTALHPDVSQREGQRQRIVVVEPESGQVADRAVHAVGGNDILGPDHVAAVQRDLGVIGGLAHPGGDVRAMDPAAEFLEAVEQDLLGDVLRDHQRVRILRREPVEPDRHELAIPIANAELPSVDTEPRQSLRDVDLLEHLQGPGVHNGGARRIRSCRLPINHCDVMAMPDQRGGNRQAHRPRTDHQHLGPIRKLTHHGPSFTEQ
jgi:hypothetical protein